MKKSFLFIILSFLVSHSFAQCPDLLQAMVNSCGTSEGNNEFVVFKTQASDSAGAYTLNYGSSNPPSVNNLAGVDATVKTGTGSVTTTGNCSVVEVTSSSTVIPSDVKVIFISASLDQNYDVTGLCDGTNPIYVVYIKTNTAGGTSSNWSVGGTMSNSTSTPRYLQVTYIGSISCSGTNAPVKAYSAVGNWTNLSGTSGDGNFVTWADTAASYGNNGCTSIVTPLSLISFQAENKENIVVIKWTTAQEINMEGYELQRSTDGLSFKDLKYLPAKNLSTFNTYQYDDKENLPGVVYYRLKMVDHSGNVSYSKIVSVVSKNNQLGAINLYPNPSTDVIKIQYYSSKATQIKIAIFDMQGRLILQKSQPLITGYNECAIPVKSIATGKYSVQMITESNTQVMSFYKK